MEKLKSVIDRLMDDDIVKIGTSYGNAFFFIGTKKDWEQKKHEENESEKKQGRTDIKVTRRKIEKLRKEMEEAIKVVEGLRKKISTCTERAFVGYENERIDLEDRNVLDVRCADDPGEVDSICIIVEGFTKGNHWSVSEVMNGTDK